MKKKTFLYYKLLVCEKCKASIEYRDCIILIWFIKEVIISIKNKPLPKATRNIKHYWI